MNQQLSWRTIVGYSLGDVANNFAFAMGALFLLSYYTDVAGVGAGRDEGGAVAAQGLDLHGSPLRGRKKAHSRWALLLRGGLLAGDSRTVQS